MQLHRKLQMAITAVFLMTGSVSISAQTVETPTPSALKSYSATAVHSLPGQPETSGKIIKSGQNMRLEFEQDGQAVIQILRPSEGLMYVLNPTDQTYFEIRGQAVPATKTEGYTTPCVDAARMARCERIGTDTVSGIVVERWALASKPRDRALIILWDSTRRRALRQEFPDGSVMAMDFQAMENLNGRMTEHWSINITSDNQPANTGSWWFDPELRVVVREDLPGGEMRRLDEITTGAVDETAFAVPQGWQKLNAPAPPATAPTAPASK